MKLRTIAGAVACLGLLLGCGSDEVEETKVEATPVTVERVVAEAIEIRIEATGQLIARDRAEVAAEVAGQITEMNVDEGSAVAAGDVVMTIDPERRRLELNSARALVDEAQAAVREGERDFARRTELFGRNVASQTQLDQSETELTLAQSRLMAAKAQLGVAERALEDATVRAPFAGMIAQRFVSRGEYVSAGTKLYELVALDPIEVEFRLTEADSGRVEMGQRVAVRVAPHPDEVFRGEVIAIAPVIDEASRTLRVKAQIENHDTRLRPGLFARVDLGLDTRANVVMVPEQAVLQRADGAVIFRARPDGHVDRVVVETGITRDGRIEVVDGISAGDHVVTRGNFRLADGQAVSPRTADGELVGALERGPDVSGSPN